MGGIKGWKHVQVTAVRRRCLADTIKDTLGDVLGVHANKRRGEESQDRDEREFHILTRGRLRDSRRDGRFGEWRRSKPGMYSEGVFNERIFNERWDQNRAVRCSALSVQEDIVMLSSRRARQADERVTEKRRSSMLTETDM